MDEKIISLWFPHFMDGRNDKRIRRLRNELRVEGYGVYYMVLEILMSQKGFRYPLEDIDLLAQEIGTTEAVARTVICNYKLFEIDDKQNFFSHDFNESLVPLMKSIESSRFGGLVSAKRKQLASMGAEVSIEDARKIVTEEIKNNNKNLFVK